MHFRSKLFFLETLTQNIPVKPNKSGQTLVNIAKDLKLFYVNHLSPGLSSRDISFSVADDHMDSDHFPIQISLDKPLKRNTHLTELVTDLTKQMMTCYTTH